MLSNNIKFDNKCLFCQLPVEIVSNCYFYCNPCNIGAYYFSNIIHQVDFYSDDNDQSDYLILEVNVGLAHNRTTIKYGFASSEMLVIPYIITNMNPKNFTEIAIKIIKNKQFL